MVAAARLARSVGSTASFTIADVLGDARASARSALVRGRISPANHAGPGGLGGSARLRERRRMERSSTQRARPRLVALRGLARCARSSTLCRTAALLGVGNSLPVRHVDAFCRARPAAGSRRLVAARGRAASTASFRAPPVRHAPRRAPRCSSSGTCPRCTTSAASRRPRETADVPLVVVVLNNDGGRIFEQLPLADRALPGEELRFWTTPHGASFDGLARLFRLDRPRRPRPSPKLEASRSRRLFRAHGCTVVEVVVPAHGARASTTRSHRGARGRRDGSRSVTTRTADDAPRCAAPRIHRNSGQLPARHARALVENGRSRGDPDAARSRPASARRRAVELRHFEGEVDRLARTVSASAPRRWHLAGYSLGGRRRARPSRATPGALCERDVDRRAARVSRPTRSAPSAASRTSAGVACSKNAASKPSWMSGKRCRSLRPSGACPPRCSPRSARSALRHDPAGLVAKSLRRDRARRRCPRTGDALLERISVVRPLFAVGAHDEKFSAIADAMARALPRGDRRERP